MSYETDAKKFAWSEPALPVTPPPRRLMLRVLAAESGLFVRLPTIPDIQRACDELGLTLVKYASEPATPAVTRGENAPPDYKQLLRNIIARCHEALPTPPSTRRTDELGARTSAAVEGLIERYRTTARELRSQNLTVGRLEDRITELEDAARTQADETDVTALARATTQIGELTRSAEASLAGRRLAEAKVAGLQAAIIDLESQLEAVRAALRSREGA